MGQVGRWIDWRCKTHPDVMRRVLGRKFGDLSTFLDGEKCGCLIGSWGLETNAEWTRKSIAPFRIPNEFDVGTRVFYLTTWKTRLGAKRTDAFVIRLLKQRIRKSLGIAPVRVPLTVESDETVTV